MLWFQPPALPSQEGALHLTFSTTSFSRKSRSWGSPKARPEALPRTLPWAGTSLDGAVPLRCAADSGGTSRCCHLKKVPARSGNQRQVHNTKCHRQFVLARTVAPGATAPTKGSGRSNTEVSTSKQFQTSQTSKDRERPRQMCRGLLPGPRPPPHLFHAQEATAAPEASASLPAMAHVVLGPTVRMERSRWSPKRGRRPCCWRGSFLQPAAGCQPRAPTSHSPNPPRICSAGPSGKAPACSVWHTQPTSRSHPKISKATRAVAMPCQQGPPIARELQRHEAQGREQGRGGTTDPGWEGWGDTGRVPRPTGRASALQHWSTSWWQCSLRASSCALSQDTPRNLASCSTIVTRSWNTRAERGSPSGAGPSLTQGS